METRRGTLRLLLGRNNYEKIPEEIAKRVDKVLDEAHLKLTDLEHRSNGSQKTIEKLQKDLKVSCMLKGNVDELLSNSETCVNELRQQLNAANVEVTLLTEQVEAEEKQNENWRKKRDDLVDENKQLKDSCGSKDTSISQLQSELASVKEQFELSANKNQKAEKRIAEMTQQEHFMIDNETILKAQIERLNNEIIKLTDMCHAQATELTLAREDAESATVQLEIDLGQKTEELSAANFTICQLTESTQLSTSHLDGELVQLKIQLNKSVAMIEHYKRELDAQIKLVDLYKTNFEECQDESISETTSLNEALQQSTEKCVMLESTLKNLNDQHRLELTEMNATIEKLQDELKAAGDSLKSAESEQAEKVLEKLFPRAATSNHMLKSSASLTEIFSRYNDSLDEIHRLEVECLHLNTKLECATMKLDDTTAEFERQQVEYRKILQRNEEMTEQVDAVVAEQDNLREKLKENSQRLANAESENVQLKCTQKDLARQICNLLNKVETDGNEPTSDQLQFKRLGLSNETIRKELITFDNIVELQENNQKLMLKIRELSSKIEKLEEQNIKLKSCEQKIPYLERQVNDGEATRLANDDLLAMTMKQKERFKQLYFDAMSYMGKPTVEMVDNAPSTTHHSTADREDKKLSDVERELQERVKELKSLKEEHDDYREQATINFNMLKEQCESVESKVDELIAQNCILRSQENFTSEQLNAKQHDVVMFKKHVEILEQRNQMYDNTIAKHELANNLLRQEYWNAIMQLSTVENRCSYLEMECRRLIEAKKNLEIENGALHRQKMTQSLLESSCELAKISSERSGFEGRIQMEQRLEDQVQQCEVLKRKLQDERVRFNEVSESLKRERDNAINKLSDEQAQTDSLRKKLSESRDKFEAKHQQYNCLSEKLQDILVAGNSAASLSKKCKSIKELEVDMNKKNAEIEKLNLQLEEFATKTKLFDKLKSNFEAEMIGLKKELDACKLSDSNSKQHIKELQYEIRILLAKNSGVEAQNMQAENKNASEKVIESNKELQELRRQCNQLNENLQIVKKNYAEVLSAHALDLQSLTTLRAELSNCQEETDQLRLAAVKADELKVKTEMIWGATNKKLIDDLQELQGKVEGLEKQMFELVNLLPGQSMKLSNDDSLNESVANSSIINRTFTDEEFEKLSSEKLLGVVKYLRREKDIAVTQMEVLTIEITRLSAELDMQTNTVNALTGQLNVGLAEPLTPSVNNVELSAEYEELRRAAGTLTAMTDSNILLRAENKDLCKRIEDLAEKIASLEGELLRTIKVNRELLESKAEMAQENSMLRENVDKLKIGGDCLKSELERLVADKEKQRQTHEAELTSEKEKQRQATETINLMKAEKSRLQQEIETKSKHIQTLHAVRMKEMQKAQLKASAESELEAKNEAKSFENQSFGLNADKGKVPKNEPSSELSKKHPVTSPEGAPPATASLRKPIGLKRSRDNDAVRPVDTKGASAVAKISPQLKRTRLQHGCESGSTKSNDDEDIDVETVFDDDVALLPGAQQVDEQLIGTVDDEPSTTVGDDGESTVESEDFQIGRIRRTSRTEAVPVRRGRSRLKK